MFMQVELRFLEQFGTSRIGGFEGRLAKMPFDLLSGNTEMYWSSLSIIADTTARWSVIFLNG